MVRPVSAAWTWAPPFSPDPPYAAVRLKDGKSYAGPVEGIMQFATIVDEDAPVLFCPRAEALRHALQDTK